MVQAVPDFTRHRVMWHGPIPPSLILHYFIVTWNARYDILYAKFELSTFTDFGDIDQGTLNFRQVK